MYIFVSRHIFPILPFIQISQIKMVPLNSIIQHLYLSSESVIVVSFRIPFSFFSDCGSLMSIGNDHGQIKLIQLTEFLSRDAKRKQR